MSKARRYNSIIIGEALNRAVPVDSLALQLDDEMVKSFDRESLGFTHLNLKSGILPVESRYLADLLNALAQRKEFLPSEVCRIPAKIVPTKHGRGVKLVYHAAAIPLYLYETHLPEDCLPEGHRVVKDNKRTGYKLVSVRR